MTLAVFKLVSLTFTGYFLFCFFFFLLRTLVQRNLARTTQPVRPVLQTEITSVCVFLDLLAMTVKTVGKTLSSNLNRDEMGKGGGKGGVRELRFCCDAVPILTLILLFTSFSAVDNFVLIFYNACCYC